MDRDLSALVRRRIALVAALVALPLAAVAALAGAPAARAASCSPPKYPGQGYFTSLSVAKVGCATGRKVAVAYYKCRIKKGRSGRCTSKVLGYSCRETKRVKIPTELDARVSCSRGARRVTHTYQQNL
ncbi:MAG: hypothetical protein QOD69_2844 [Solirubrobacteraceae bacterium]|nr:hypothetical protein [Solirubrobacteraceae bacterium]